MTPPQVTTPAIERELTPPQVGATPRLQSRIWAVVQLWYKEILQILTFKTWKSFENRALRAPKLGVSQSDH